MWCGPSRAERRRYGCSGQTRAERGRSGVSGSGHLNLKSRFADDGWRLRVRRSALWRLCAPVMRADLTPSADRPEQGFVNFTQSYPFSFLACLGSRRGRRMHVLRMFSHLADLAQRAFGWIPSPSASCPPLPPPLGPVTPSLSRPAPSPPLPSCRLLPPLAAYRRCPHRSKQASGSPYLHLSLLPVCQLPSRTRDR